MKKIYAIFTILILTTGCYSHVSEDVLGYNEHGQTIVRVCKSTGNPANPVAFGSSCSVELRNYGRINHSNTINVISDYNR
jgi:hypothetical protein